MGFLSRGRGHWVSLGSNVGFRALKAVSSPHAPVMRRELLALLAPRTGGTYVDLTAGAGGHLEAILEASSPHGRCVGIDRDRDALRIARERLARFGSRVTLVHGNARDLVGMVAQGLGSRDAPVDGIILDAGVSSMQLDQPDRGFSFRHDGPLDMRMDQTAGMTAAQVVNGQAEAELAATIASLGEERHAWRVARAIVSRRVARPFTSTTDLADVVARAVPGTHRGSGMIHPATRTFQAIRIAVNGELEALQAAIPAAIRRTASGGRVVAITFHSLEDRIVKHAFRDAAGRCTCPPRLPVCACGARATVRVLTPRPLMPGDDEIAANPRSRSARLRAVEVLGPPTASPTSAKDPRDTSCNPT